MALWGVVFLVALGGITVSTEPLATFPEEIIARTQGSRIVSGWEADDGQLPYQLSLRMVNPVGTVSACGGSIIHAGWGLTAAHCTASRVTIVIRAGCANLTRPEILFETADYYNHPDYIDALQSVVQPNDIALLRFNRLLTWSDRVQPIRLQSSKDMNKNYDGLQLVASGWGRTWTNGASPENLNWVYLSGITNLACWHAFSQSSIIQDSTICAAYWNVTSQSTCQGDSGGLLTIVEDDGIVTQIGVTSFVSSTGCHTEIPAGFIRSGHYHDWYKHVTGGIDFDWDPDASSEEEGSSSEEASESSEEDAATTAAPETEGTTEAAETEAPTTAAPETEGTTEAAETDAPTTAAPETEGTTEAAETDAPTTAAPETEGTTEAAETEAPTTAAPDTEGTTEAAETEAPTTAAPETEGTTEAAETEAPTTAAPETEGTTEAAETEAPTTAAPEEEVTTPAPEEDSEESEEEQPEPTTAAPEVEETDAPTTEVQQPEATTAAPEVEEGSGDSEEEVEEIAQNFMGQYLRRFWRWA